MNIKVLQLITGQAVIGDLQRLPAPNLNNALYVMTKPMEVAIVPGAGGRPQLALMPYGTAGGLLPAMDTAEFKEQHVQHVRECPQQLADYYTQSASGIAIARGRIDGTDAAQHARSTIIGV